MRRVEEWRLTYYSSRQNRSEQLFKWGQHVAPRADLPACDAVRAPATLPPNFVVDVRSATNAYFTTAPVFGSQKNAWKNAL